MGKFTVKVVTYDSESARESKRYAEVIGTAHSVSEFEEFRAKYPMYSGWFDYVDETGKSLSKQEAHAHLQKNAKRITVKTFENAYNRSLDQFSNVVGTATDLEELETLRNSVPWDSNLFFGYFNAETGEQFGSVNAAQTFLGKLPSYLYHFEPGSEEG